MTSILHDEIFEQPAVIRRLLGAEQASIAQLGAQLAAYRPRFVLIAARGTSDNAARYAQYVFGARNQLTVALAAPSLFSMYQTPPQLEGALVVGISQSGQSPDIVSVLEEAQRQGAPTIAITNDDASPLAKAAEHVIPLHAGVERSIAATKTYTAQLAALALLSTSMSPAPQDIDAFNRIPEAMETALRAEEAAHAAAERLAPHDRCVVLGRGFNYATTFEVALKIKELSYTAAEPYSSADFKHGPIALVQPGFPVVLVAAGERMQAELRELSGQLQQRGAELIVLSDDAAMQAPGKPWLAIPAGLPEWLTPLVAILPGQLLAYQLAIARGFDPEQPRTLSKVTLTK